MTLIMIEGHYLLLAHSITYFYWLKALELDYHSEWVLVFYSGIRGNCTAQELKLLSATGGVWGHSWFSEILTFAHA